MGSRSAVAQKVLPGPRLARANAAQLAGPIGASAIRVSTHEASRVRLALVPPPRLFVHEGSRQSLERRLVAAFLGPVRLSITDNRHTIVSHSTHAGVLVVRLHHMFLDAAPRVVDALVRYLVLGDRDASLRVSAFIDAHSSRLACRVSRSGPLVTRGKTHDLLSIFRELNERYFGGACDALVTWGQRSRKSAVPRRSLKLGSYSDVDRLARIHPVLDRPWVPRYFVAFVLYHELLHHMIPAARGEGRRQLHPPELRAREREFRAFDRAHAWERRNLHRLFRSA